jgi:hypothetical protein
LCFGITLPGEGVEPHLLASDFAGRLVRSRRRPEVTTYLLFVF